MTTISKAEAWSETSLLARSALLHPTFTAATPSHCTLKDLYPCPVESDVMGASLSSGSGGLFRSTPTGPFQPTLEDAQETFDLLATLLPPELVLLCMDAADYWPVESTKKKLSPPVRVFSRGPIESLTVIHSKPITGAGRNSEVEEEEGGSAKWIRRVSITIESKDQGFSSFPQYHGTREGSSSWFDLALIRPKSPRASSPTDSSPSTSQHYTIVKRKELFRNIHAGRNFVSHTVSFDRGDEIVDDAVIGDRFCVIALAQYPQWSCEVSEAAIDVFYSI